MTPRKKTDTAALLSINILFRVRQQEYEQLLHLAQQSDCRSVGEVVRRILENRRILLFHRDTSLDGVVEELAGIREELRAIGVNINQITRYFNASTQAHKRVFLAQQALEQYGQVGHKANTLLTLLSQQARRW
ncbi:plasmid mobilization relaxosome protein MobC [Pontibacter sp. HSC-14F20]|uniref:plasmid mobilization protein n=1 Tax=Pontibacter sp. HSC-14F20 TaxID=2864136 RepID=UPI001C72F98B|nr:plasmid mobilization relaxosome protein MobC [Pontibacter sp. HSC-14F20]MBX0335376.1 plasmid mobilization relaxosome protein MobC [Pontibacter sp. HSC-14F20]